LAVGLLWYLFNINCPWIDASYATAGYLRYHHYVDKTIDARIDPNDLETLKEILQGRACPEWLDGEPACGFGTDVSITFTDGRRRITLCPACDKCDTVWVANTKLYFDMGERERKRFEKIVAKYGMTFPCE
jgi:hypothetical protein